MRMQLKEVFQRQQISGTTVMANGLTITPQSQALIVRFPMGIFVWHRPTSVLVERNGEVKRFSIVDVTRLLQLGFLGAGAMVTIAGLLARKRRKENMS
jgi:LPXTG-motif cell wall-anchored protein